MAGYLQEATSFRDFILDKYKNGTLSSGVPLAKVNSVSIDIVDSNMPKPTLNFDEQNEDKRRANAWEYYKWVVAQMIKKQESNGDADLGLTLGIDEDSGKKPAIFLNAERFEDVQSRLIHPTTLHEMAHALDGCLRKPQEEMSACYKWLNDDLKQYKNNKQIDVREWHADKQGDYWMKEHWPEEALFWKNLYTNLLALIGENQDLKYAPIAKRIEWLSATASDK